MKTQENEFISSLQAVLGFTTYRGCLIQRLPNGEYARGGKQFKNLEAAKEDLDKKFDNWAKAIQK